MNKLTAYWQLMRFDKPVGTLLLWYPTAWALWFANKGFPPIHLLFLFAMGTLLMRAAGCVVNDIADRNVDLLVQRTHSRPLTSGKITLPGAFSLATILLFSALLILVNLPVNCFYWALIALALTIIYPFCKRFLRAPQLVLGLAFSMGIPMAYVASATPFDRQFFLLCIINFLWILAYDTMYAMADREDDLRIGVKSMAIYLASYDRLVIGLLQFIMHGLWLLWALLNNVGWGFYILWSIATLILFYQQQLIQDRHADYCFKAFKVSIYYGLLLWLAVMLGF